MLKISKLIFASALILVLSSAQWNIGKLPELVFKNPHQNLGELNMGDVKDLEFEFVNAGRAPLIITEVKTSCGCTVTNFPKKPIQKGEKHVIWVTFHAEAPGAFRKTITVISNSKNREEEIVIEGIVKQ